MKEEFIKIRGAKTHNLKNVSVDIPRNKLVVITGVSGSGKSSLAFDTLYAEGQRRYVESLSSYGRNFLEVMDKPEVEKIEGISPAISIDQRKAVRNPRSTVGTITEIYDYLRLLFSKIGQPHCFKCGRFLSSQDIGQILKRVIENFSNNKIIIFGSVVKNQKGSHRKTLEEIKRNGYVRVRVDKIIYSVRELPDLLLDPEKTHNIEIVIDELIVNSADRKRLKDSLSIALRLGRGAVLICSDNKETAFNSYFACDKCGVSFPELEPRLFSFNSPIGACPECTGLGEKLEVDPDLIMPNSNLTIAEGAIIPWMRAFNKIGKESQIHKQISELARKRNFSLDEPIGQLPSKIIDILLYGENILGGFEGAIAILEKKYYETDSEWTRQEIEKYMKVKQCPECFGKRLRPESLAVKIKGYSIDQISEMSIDKVKRFFDGLLKLKDKNKELKISKPIIEEIISRCNLVIDVGLGYLSLIRETATLSGGEEQRIKISLQIGSNLAGVLYVLDEPSVGLHPKDQKKLIDTLKNLRDFGNTVVVVEHDLETIRQCDWVIDVGPGAGKYGGKIIFSGTPKELLKAKTLTGKYLSGKLKISSLRPPQTGYGGQVNFLEIRGAEENNLKNINVKILLGKFICITGVSGSGKSSLINDILAKALLKKFYKIKEEPGKYKEILGAEFLNKVVLIDQLPIGRTSRSNPATYTGIFSHVRVLFSETREAKVRNYNLSFFSFNVKGGRCEACEGQGQKKIEMYFMPDIYVECEECKGKRYNKEALEIEYRGKNISEVLEMTIEEAAKFFQGVSVLEQKLRVLRQVGLSYMELGQPAPSLSGGEAQRIKLATELSRKSSGRTLYLLDEPTTGLHLDDINKLIKVLNELVNKGNTVVCIEHNPDFIRCADWIIDLGPEGGDKGGYIVAQGTPREIAKNKKSHTGRYLKLDKIF